MEAFEPRLLRSEVDHFKAIFELDNVIKIVLVSFKNGVRLLFDPISSVEFEHFDQKKFLQA